MHNYLSGYVFFFILFCSVTASAEIVTLKNGDSINIVVKDETDFQLIAEHQSLGKLIILREQIISIHHEREELPVDNAITPAIFRGMFNTDLLEGWERRLEMGLDGSAGNSDNTTLRSAINLKYEDDKSRWNSETHYYMSRDDNDTSENNATTDLERDWLIKDSKWFYFSLTGIDWDEQKDWTFRLRQSGGCGYQFIRNEKWDALSRLGLGVKHVMGSDVNDETTMEALLGFAVKRNIKDNYTIECSNTLFPSLTNIGKYRNVSNLNWLIKFGDIRGFGLRVGLRNEYDSTLDDSKNDADYIASITWDF